MLHGKGENVLIMKLKQISRPWRWCQGQEKI